LNDEVLRNSNRGHTSYDVYKSAEMIKDYGFNLGLQMMLGLPGDSLENALYTTLEFIKLKPYCVRIYPTLVIKETYLEKIYLDNLYSPLSLEESIDITTPILILFYLNNINVIRVGLQPTDNIQLGKDVVAGPFHPAYRQLVESNIFKLILDNYIEYNNIETEGKIMIVESENRNISNIAGQKALNISYFKEKYSFKKIQIFSSNVENGYINIIVGEVKFEINIEFEMQRIISNNSTLNNLMN
jgi:histone acetyltransferase (RNA polymerase elongator complex component)